MANTFDADLILDTMGNAAITVLQNKLAPLSAFATQFTTDSVRPRGTIQVPVATAASTTQTNPSDFEVETATEEGVPVTVNHYNQPFGLTAQEINQGFQLTRLAKIHLRKLANKILDVAYTPITVANYGSAAVNSTAANFDSADLQTLWAALEDGSMRNVVLDSAWFAKFLPTSRESLDVNGRGAYGFDGMYHCSRWDGAGTNVCGFAASPEAMAVAAGLPHNDLTPPGEVMTSLTLIPDLGITVQSCLWFARKSRSWRASYDLMFGAAAVDTSALKIVTNGA
jgi:hypothetical protein